MIEDNIYFLTFSSLMMFVICVLFYWSIRSGLYSYHNKEKYEK